MGEAKEAQRLPEQKSKAVRLPHRLRNRRRNASCCGFAIVSRHIMKRMVRGRNPQELQVHSHVKETVGKNGRWRSVRIVVPTDADWIECGACS